MTRARLRSVALSQAAAIRGLHRERAASAASAAGALSRDAQSRSAAGAERRALAEQSWHDLMGAPGFDPGLAALAARTIMTRQAEFLVMEKEAEKAGEAATAADAALGRATALADVAEKLAGKAVRRARHERDERALLEVEDRSSGKARS